MNKKGVTLLEIMLSFLVMFIIVMTANKVFILNMSFIKDVTAKKTKVAQAQNALTHFNYNIQQSSWIAVEDKNTVVLHSHSFPRLRTYKFDNNELLFIEGTDSGTGEKSRTVLVEHIDQGAFFKGIGQKKAGNKYRMISIYFRLKGYPSETFYTTAHGKEEFAIEYADAAGAGYADGSRTFPYTSLVKALDAQENAVMPRQNTIVFLAGDYTIGGQINIKQGNSIAFSPDTSLKLGSGSVVSMGKDSRVSVGGEFSCSGDKNTIEITSPSLNLMNSYANIAKYGYDYFYIADAKAGAGQYDIKGLSMSGSKVGMVFRGFKNKDTRLDFSNNTLSLYSLKGLSVQDFKTINLYDNNIASPYAWHHGVTIMTNTLSHYYPKLWQFGYTGLYYSIYNNELGGNGTGVCFTIRPYMDIYPITVNLDMRKNLFTNSEYGLLYNSAFPRWGFMPYLNISVSENIFKSKYGIYMNPEYAVKTSVSKIYVKNNTFAVGQKGLILLGGRQSEIFVDNNKFGSLAAAIPVGITQYTYSNTSAKYLLPTINILNNIFYCKDYVLDAGYIDPVYSSYTADRGVINFNNNVAAGGGVIDYKGVDAGYAAYVGGFTAVNNTFDKVLITGDPKYMTMKNNIVWGETGKVYMDAGILAKNTYANIINVSPDNGKFIISDEPVFTNRNGGDYSLVSALKYHDGQTALIGAYEGTNAGGWQNGIGADESTVGVR